MQRPERAPKVLAPAWGLVSPRRPPPPPLLSTGPEGPAICFFVGFHKAIGGRTGHLLITNGSFQRGDLGLAQRKADTLSPAGVS